MSAATDMISTAARASHFLQADDVKDVVHYLQGLIQPDGGFRGRSTSSDLYYTVFGGACLLALKHPPNLFSFRRYLTSFGDGQGLDFVHAVALVRGWAALPLGLSRARQILPRIAAHQAADGGYNPSLGALQGTAYAAFLSYLAYAESGVPFPLSDALRKSLASLRTENGGYANALNVRVGTTTASAAVVLLKHALWNERDDPAVESLLASACPQGGFRASCEAPGPDLLSTATALYALHTVHVPYAQTAAHLNFIETLWDDDGGFRGHAADSMTDCEYTFYALLSLGCLHAG